MNSSLIGVIAGLIAGLAFIPYIISIFRGETKPQRATIFIWSVVSFVALASYYASGARDTIWVILAYTVLQNVILALSFKYGMGGFEKLDIICLAGAGLGIALWIISNDPRYALYFSIIAELFGYMPTLKKTYLMPETENLLAWSLGTISGLINIFAITSLTFDIATYPIYVFLTDSIVLTLIAFSPKRTKKLKLL